MVKDGLTFKYTGRTDRNNHEFKTGENYIWSFKYWLYYYEGCFTLEDWEGIPLTEDILIKLGFEKEKVFKSNDYIFSLPRQGVKANIKLECFSRERFIFGGLGEGFPKRQVNYFHEVQELYFIIYGIILHL